MDRSTQETLHPPFSLQGTAFRPSFYKLDEGYSEETRSQADNEASMTEALLAVPEQIMGLGESDRAEFAYNVLRTLRTSTIASVVDRLTPLLHLDPVAILPPEITSEIFSYLDPATLLTASMSSMTWRDRILDSRLWKQMYAREGWGLDMGAVREFERRQSETRKSRTRRAETDAGQPKIKRRITVQPPSVTSAHHFASSANNKSDQSLEFGQENERRSLFDKPMEDTRSDSQGDEEMKDVSDESTPSSQNSPVSRSGRRMPTLLAQESSTLELGESSLSPSSSHRDPVSLTYQKRLLKLPNSSALLYQLSNSAKINWQHLYKQRRRLEDNWNTGTYTNFQLPHPQYPQEAHTECVYTIQFVGKWLVSGSRDKTVRVWDLETKRLRGQPMTGHSQSVLCLQFDPSEKEDVIISGSSDTDVIVWQFSTGRQIHKISKAHRESVLNLRFDHRYLVTCSKDKLIKIWSRQTLRATDKDYPKISANMTAKVPKYIVNIADMPSLTVEARIASGHIRTIQPYEHLMTLEGHNAAVNAIQIDEDEVVSASGDRQIKVWNIHDGSCIRTLPGHQKGIACVQMDTRRIVSGSSDNTVRIFDHATGAEVACLNGHSNLVRTVQAGFGDLPGGLDDLRTEAEAVDRDFWAANRAGLIPTQTTRAMRRSHLLGNAGSRKPTHLTAIGAKIPPGGGGSQWGRIVSGSYDETIIIWKKSPDGRWIVNQKLRQDEAARAAGGVDLRGPAFIGNNQASLGQQMAQTQMNAPQLVQQALHTSMTSLQNGLQNVMSLNAHLTQNQPQNQHQNTGNGAPPVTNNPPTATQQGPANAPPGLTQAIHQLQSHVHNLANAQCQNPQTAQVQGQNPLPTSNIPPVPPIPQAHVPPHPTAPAQLATVNNVQVAPTQLPNSNPHPHPVLVPLGNPVANLQQPASRVFKLQFDARRIICCSQDPKIVGWDFAAGDREIEEASAFFVGP